jgi:hypothetical protein
MRKAGRLKEKAKAAYIPARRRNPTTVSALTCLFVS